MEFCTVLDATDATRIQIAKLGNFEHARYGKFSITEDQVALWKANLAKLPGGQAPIDLDHSPERGKGTEAAGWITDIDIEDGKPMASVEWTPLGKAALSEKRYRFVSPTYGEAKDETGKEIGETLVGAGLTNRPHLNMPAISLSADYDSWLARAYTLSTDFVALDGESADSRRPMELTADFLKLAGIEDEAEQKKILDLAAEDGVEDVKVLEAIEAAKPEPKKDDPDEPKTLDQLAKENGKIVLDSGAYEQLRTGASAGVESKKQLDAMTFETAFDAAKRKGLAVEADREFYTELPLDTAVKRLEKAPQIVNVRALGKDVSTEALDAPGGVDAKAYQLDQEVRKYMAEKDMKPDEYVKALHAVEDKAMAI